MNNLVKPKVFFLILLVTIFHSCKKDIVLPVLTTFPVSCIGRTSALFQGTMSYEGTDSIFEHGFCWSTLGLPTLTDNHEVNNNTIDNIFYLWRNSLLINTKYFIRAYAITNSGTAYGNTVDFTTKPGIVSITFNPDLSYGSVSDIDGNNYKTVGIGSQVWMAENLKTTSFNDGSTIPLVEEDEAWSLLRSPGYCWFQNNEEVFRNIFGAYYNWYTISAGLLCPAGWHVPTEEDWKVLKISLGMTEEQAEITWGPVGSNEGDKIKETGTINWTEGSTQANNESGFTGLPGGVRTDYPGNFGSDGTGASWWSATSYAISVAWSHHATYNDSRMWRSDMLTKSYGLNVRCIKDNK